MHISYLNEIHKKFRFQILKKQRKESLVPCNQLEKGYVVPTASCKKKYPTQPIIQQPISIRYLLLIYYDDQWFFPLYSITNTTPASLLSSRTSSESSGHRLNSEDPETVFIDYANLAFVPKVWVHIFLGVQWQALCSASEECVQSVMQCWFISEDYYFSHASRQEEGQIPEVIF